MHLERPQDGLDLLGRAEHLVLANAASAMPPALGDDAGDLHPVARELGDGAQKQLGDGVEPDEEHGLVRCQRHGGVCLLLAAGVAQPDGGARADQHERHQQALDHRQRPRDTLQPVDEEAEGDGAEHDDEHGRDHAQVVVDRAVAPDRPVDAGDGENDGRRQHGYGEVGEKTLEGGQRDLEIVAQRQRAKRGDSHKAEVNQRQHLRANTSPHETPGRNATTPKRMITLAHTRVAGDPTNLAVR